MVGKTLQVTFSMPPEMMDWIEEEKDEGQTEGEFIRDCIRKQTILNTD
jgi:hypothetical protein